ncbi:MAG: response regulator [Planctomycetota bacterium]
MSTRVVYIIDDDEDMRRSIAMLLESVGLSVVACESLDAFEACYDEQNAGCVLADVRMPRRSGLELVGTFTNPANPVPLIMISGHADVPMAVGAVRDGAFDFFEKPFSGQTLIDRVNAALDAERLRRRQRTHIIDLRRKFASLTQREWQVLKLLMDGMSSADAGSALSLSPRTIDMHRSRILRKTGASSLVELVRMATELQDQDRAYEASPPATM